MRDYAKTGSKNGLPGYRTPSSFKMKIFEIVRKIPKGRTLTYKQVAKLSGNPHAYRAVGNILSKNYNPGIPCHRVIRSDGKLGGYNKGTTQKEKILEKEGFVIK